MKEELITFKTAKLADSKGMDLKKVDANYNRREWYTRSGNLNGYTPKEPYWACAQSLLQKILREVYNIDVEPYLVLMTSNNREIEQNISNKEYTYKLSVKGVSQFVSGSKLQLTYEQALEIGLQEALKLIKKE